METFARRFYYYFLQTKAGLLFKQTEKEKQYQMFAVSLKIIFNHINNPPQMVKQLDNLISNHQKYGVMRVHADYFIESFLKALKEVFENQKFDTTISNLWLRVISDILGYFQQGFEK